MSGKTYELNHGAPTTRFEVYFGTHKALRSLMCNTLLQLGKVDPAEPQEAALAVSQLRDLFRLIELRREFTLRHMLPTLQRYGLDTAALHADEQAAARAVQRLRRLCVALELAGPLRRGAGLARLYASLAVLIEDSIPALRRNELCAGELPARGCPAQELAFMQDAMLAGMDEQRLRHWMYWTMPALHAGERSAVLSLVATQLSCGELKPIVAMLEDVLPRNAHRRLLEQFDTAQTRLPRVTLRRAAELYL